MSISKKIARSYVLPLALLFKADKYFLSKKEKTCCIINFHGVRKHNENVFNNRHVPEREFERIIRYLNKNYNIVPLKELFEIHRRKESPSKKTIALTFDDGYENNFTIALPILKKYNTPATFFIISKSLIEDNFASWPDVIDVVKKYHGQDITVDNLNFEYPHYHNKEKGELLNYLKTRGDQAEAIAHKLLGNHDYFQKELKASPELLANITGRNFAAYANEPLIEFGSHTHTHPSLEYLTKDKVEMELKESKQILESKIGKPVLSLAFPDGSYNKETLSIAKDLGYLNMVAVNYYFKENNQDPNLLSRFTISNSTTFESNVLRLSRDFDLYGF
ncbi:MAG: polysaccharide deacetylase family protein [Bacteroidetes bacterium]|nr:polysaccharide deacetylase family protein [Bacteroidota bacterium]